MTHAFQNVVLYLCLADLAAIACVCAFVGFRQVGRWIRSRLRPVALMAFAVAATIVTSEAQKRGGDGGAGTSAQPIVQSIPGAVTNSYWLARGAYEDWFYLPATNWWARMPGGGWIDRLRIFSFGGFQTKGTSGGAWTNYPPPFPQKFSMAPMANWHMLTNREALATSHESLFWHGVTESNTLVMTWQDGLYERCATNLVSFQAELFNNGSVAYRYDGSPVATNDFIVPLELPFDRDGDGLENSVDPEPDVAGPDAHGTSAEWYNVVCSNVFSAVEGGGHGVPALPWRDGVNSNAYYFVDVVAERGPSPICFTGDRTCRLGNPALVALAGETNRVPLLIGINYAVTSDTPFSVSFPVDYTYVEVETNEPCVARIRWPLDFEFTESIGPSNRTYAVAVVPYDPGGEFSWGDGGGVPMRGGTPGGGCSCVSYDGHGVVFGCTEQCPCAGTCLAVGTYSLENASFPFSGGECRCGFVDPDPPAPPPPSEQPSFSVSFSNAAVIFEDTYQDKPGVWKPRRSTRVWVSISATGGPYGGSFTLVTENLGKLTPVACGPMVFPPSMDLGPYGLYRASFLCEGATQSDSAGDVRMSGTFVENETGASFTSSNSLTVVRVEFKPIVHPPQGGTLGRHKYGVCEQVEHQQFPAAPAVTWNPVGGGYDAVGANNQSSYNFPLYACEKPLRVELGDVSYEPLLSCIEPTGIVTGTVDLCTYGLPPGKAGGIGLLQEMYVTPLTVSFSRISVEEVPCDQGSVEGYFRYATPTNLWSHTRAAGAGVWRNVDIHNRVGGENNVRDEAALAEEQLPMTSDGTLTNDYSCGWIDGLTVWQVPSGWNVRNTNGETEPFKTFGTVTQEFYIDRWGQTTVQKFGNRATRLLNGRRFLNSREIK